MPPKSLPKAIAAARKIKGFNSQIAVDPLVADLTPANAEELLGGVDLILDGTDNFETRYLINDFAVASNLPWIYSAAVASYAVTMTILPGETACLACVFPDSPHGMVETCDTVGHPEFRRKLCGFDRCNRGHEADRRSARQGSTHAACPTTCGPTTLRRS